MTNYVDSPTAGRKPSSDDFARDEPRRDDRIRKRREPFHEELMVRQVPVRGEPVDAVHLDLESFARFDLVGQLLLGRFEALDHEVELRGNLHDLVVALETDPCGEVTARDAPNARDRTIAAERQAAVRKAVNDLPEDMREAIILCEWEELSVVEAADVAGTTPKALESRLYRARQILRAELKTWM